MRARMMISQSRGMINAQVVGRPQGFPPGSPNTQFQASRNPLDPYGHLVVHQQRMQGGIVSSPSMLAQQLGRPLQSVGQQSHDNMSSPMQSPMSANPLSQQMNPNSMQEHGALTSHLPSDHQELPDSVTAELEKLEQEQHNSHDADTSELADLGMDDDELLGMGADFNILEYADPELDEVVGGEKTNILDNLDLEEEDKEDKEPKRKEEPERYILVF